MQVTPLAIRKIILEQSFRAQVGHIGSALSVADIIAALYGKVLKITRPNDPNRDRFILSKGHAALALYSALYLKRWITKKQLEGFCGNNTQLGTHPETAILGVDFSTGSLGHGLTMGAGAALAAKIQRSRRRVFVLLSDAECNEGSVWEAAMFAAHHQLSNLVAIVDLNGQQAFGYTKEVLHLSRFSSRWRDFGWRVYGVDGHNEASLVAVMKSLSTETGAPHLLVARTIFGKGVSFMESQIKWHYFAMSREEYMQALREVEG